MTKTEFSDQLDIDLELASSLLKNNFGLLTVAAGRQAGDGATALLLARDEVHDTLQRLHELQPDEVKALVDLEKRRNDELRKAIHG